LRAAERQILAGFEHENIARLLDGGTTDEGHPYEQGSESDPKVRMQRARSLARTLRKLGYDVATTPINPATTEMGMQM
jgi:hypothetical protein